MLAVTVYAMYVAVCGCAGPNEVRRKTINQLFQEAQQSSNNRSPVIASCDELPYPAVAAENLNDESSHEVISNELLPIYSPDQPVLEPLSPPAVEEIQERRVSDVEQAFYAQSTPSPTLISELFEQTDVREAIQILASYGNISIVIDDTIGGVTSAQIQNETFDSALAKVLLPLGLEFVKEGDTYIVASPNPDSPLFRYVSYRTTYAPKHHKATELVELLPRRLALYYQVSDNRNLIVIDAPKKTSEEIHNRLQELDCPVQQVELEAIVCVSAPDGGFRFGVDWNHAVQVEGLDSMTFGLSGLAFQGKGSPGSAQNAFSDFAVTSTFIRLLAQEGYVSIRAAPRVTTKDNEKATISISRETFFSLQPSNSNVLFRQDVQKVEAGISLDITPRIRGNQISVEISKAEVSEDIRASDPSSSLASNAFPIINRRVVTTQVDVLDGHTIVIGGLVQRQTVDRVNKIPVLGDLPVAGRLFRTVDQQEQEAEVAIFICPRIVPVEYSE